MSINDRKPFTPTSADGTPVWWKVWAGFCLMVGVGICALGAWVVITLVNWWTSR